MAGKQYPYGDMINGKCADEYKGVDAKEFSRGKDAPDLNMSKEPPYVDIKGDGKKES